MLAFVVVQVDELYGLPRRGHRGLFDTDRFSNEADDGPVMVLVRLYIQKRNPFRRADSVSNGVNYILAPSLAKVGNTLY